MHLLWKIQAGMHKIVSHLIESHSVYIKDTFVSCSKVSFFFSLTLLESIFWALEIAMSKLCIKLNRILLANY